jgi:anaerobic selenocysteine-containing dehydrogenase
LYPTETVKWADVVLPAASFVEYDDLIRGYGHPYIQYQPRILEPIGETLPDMELTRRLMKAFGFDPGPLSLNDRDILQKVLDISGIPRPIEDLSREPYLFPEYDEVAFSDGVFETPSGKIELLSRHLPNIFEAGPDKTGEKGFPWILLSSHSDKGINSQFSFTPCLGIDPVLSINEEEAEDAGLEDGDRVEVWNERGNVRCTVKKTDSIRPGVLHLFFGAWDEETGSTVNRLTAGGMTDIGWGTAFHNCSVSVRRLF